MCGSCNPFKGWLWNDDFCRQKVSILVPFCFHEHNAHLGKCEGCLWYSTLTLSNCFNLIKPLIVSNLLVSSFDSKSTMHSSLCNFMEFVLKWIGSYWLSLIMNGKQKESWQASESSLLSRERNMLVQGHDMFSFKNQYNQQI